VLAHVRAERLPERLVAALPEEVEVDVADRGQEAVGVAHGEGAVGAVVDLELVVERQRRVGDDALEEPGGVHPLERRGLAAHDDVDGLRVGPERAHEHPAGIGGMGAEVPVGVGEAAVEQAGELVHESGSSSRRAMPATGMATQSGRLLSS
jgi:hypothetical protein